MRTALFGVTKSWVPFVQAIVGREHMPNWDRVWDDFIQEEIRRRYMQGSSSLVGEDEENVALAAKGRKGKAKKEGPKGGGKTHDQGKKKEKNLSKVKS